MTDLIPISTVTDAAAASRTATTTRNDQLGKDAFLQLLVAQLRYQDPLNPADSTEFMAQTAQFTMVEKLEQLAQDAARQRAFTESATATGLIGKQITWLDASGVERTGVVDGTSFGTDGATLLVGDERVPLDRVSGVRAPQAAPPADQAESTDGSASTDGTDAVETTDGTAGAAPAAAAPGGAPASGTATDPTDQTDSQEG